ncbi:hypothetical protein BBJ29_001111 [Phytophthora kernoviae]|uniref:Uncharacterized protein n=1 Tax=Phytophthora kernoviae TaxID=325452 RepID=A0A3F2S0Y1_9STRA|nr:hypothetical protein BBJ29_001111 [Phytophthora kernoviae]RLN68164.1 hypothetical protein BBP00_00001167 [Phytophthora kernoviae]
MNTSKFNNALVSLESAWICAADVDVQREEEERVEALAKFRKQRVKEKYEVASESMRLEQELKEQQLQWKKKVEQRRQRQLPEDEKGLSQTRDNNNKKKPNVYAMENLRLAMLMKDTSLRQRVKKKKIRPHIVQDMLALERRYAEIQRMFRGMMARMKIDGLLRDQETRNRQEFMAVLEVEEEWHRAQRDKLQARLNRKQLYQRVLQLEYEYFIKHEKIHDMESIFLDMQTQRMRVSPRAIEHGWVEEMEEKMKKQRALITKLKLDTIFGIGLEFKTKEKELFELQLRIDQLEEKRRRVNMTKSSLVRGLEK